MKIKRKIAKSPVTCIHCEHRMNTHTEYFEVDGRVWHFKCYIDSLPGGDNSNE